MPPSSPHVPARFLDYSQCTLAELRKFIENRAHDTLTEKDIQKLKSCTRYQLITRLRNMDKHSSFPRFMELPPELRLCVYESLLVDMSDRNEDGVRCWTNLHYKMYPAVLCTSKLVHSEAVTILYKQNEFRAKIAYAEEGSRRTGPLAGCALKIFRPGSKFPYYQKMPSSRQTPVLRRLFEDRTIGMLRMLTHMTVDLSLITPGEDESAAYVSKARDAVTTLCLSLTGASKMKELTINIDPGDPQRRDHELGMVLWPLVFLRKDIVVKFEGIPAIPETFISRLRMTPRAEAFYGRRIGEIRKSCKGEIEKRGRNHARLMDIEKALGELADFGWMIVEIADIVNLSDKWRGIRSHADRVEALRVAQ